MDVGPRLAVARPGDATIALRRSQTRSVRPTTAVPRLPGGPREYSDGRMQVIGHRRAPNSLAGTWALRMHRHPPLGRDGRTLWGLDLRGGHRDRAEAARHRRRGRAQLCSRGRRSERKDGRQPSDAARLDARLATTFKVPWLLRVPSFQKPKVALFSTDYRYLRSEEEIRRFLAAAREQDEHVFVLYATAIYTGSRPGPDFRRGAVPFAHRHPSSTRSLMNMNRSSQIDTIRLNGA
jgi:hypothetical protein